MVAKSDLGKAYGAKGGRDAAETQDETALNMMTPLEAVTQGINLMYATGPVKTHNTRNPG